MARIFDHFLQVVNAALDALEGDGRLPAGLPRGAVTVEPPRDASHGDLATNAAMVLAKPAGLNPRPLADALAGEMRAAAGVTAVEVAGPGFINLRLAPALWTAELTAILTEGADYGRSSLGGGRRINVEYVSANPTGPMHMGHCRGAVVGDALASLLAYAGYAVTREYYINDAGGQVDTLARSVHLRYREALGEAIGDIPEGLYPGDYLVPLGEALAVEFGDRFASADESEWLALFKARATQAMMALIKDDLALLGIHHDLFASEAALHAAGTVDSTLADLKARGLVYEGVLERPKGEAADDWEPRPQTLFRASRFGDDSDRALQKSDGSWTYFAGDVAYHWDKLQRGFDALVDLFGADHGGYVKRMQAAVNAMSGGRVPLDIRLVQMVRLFRAGEPVKMSKRAGSFVTLADVVREVGKDVVRFIMLTKRSDSQLDFDFAKAVEQSKDNPVFYVQYAHARVCSLARRAAEAGIAVRDAQGEDLARLDADELALIRLAAQWPRTVEAAATAREPHRIAFFLHDLASAFHSLWHRGNEDAAMRFILPEDPSLTAARLALARGVGQILANGLGIMGVTPAREMH